jgi:hypothetical protein
MSSPVDWSGRHDGCRGGALDEWTSSRDDNGSFQQWDNRIDRIIMFVVDATKPFSVPARFE